MEGSKKILSIDIGGSKFVVGTVTANGDILYCKRYVWKKLGKKAIFEQITAAVDEMFAVYGTSPEDYAAIGATLPGLTDKNTGYWDHFRLLEVEDWHIGSDFTARYGLPAYGDNDCKACALAESYFGAGRNVKDYVYMTVSNGVGGAIVIDGKLYDGAREQAGEFGMCVVSDADRDVVSNGPVGSLEQYASGRGILATYKEEGGCVPEDESRFFGRYLADLADSGDPIALRTFAREGRYLGKLLAVVCNILDPEKIILGGGLSLVFEYYRDSIYEVMDKEYFGRARISVEPTPLGYFGGLLGAVSLALRGMGIKPEQITGCPHYRDNPLKTL